MHQPASVTPSQPPPTSQLQARPYGAEAWILPSPSWTSEAAGVEMALPLKTAPKTVLYYRLSTGKECGGKKSFRVATSCSCGPIRPFDCGEL